MIPLISGTQSIQKSSDRKQKGSCQELGGGRKKELLFNGHRVSLHSMKSMALVGGNSYTELEMQQLNSTVRDGKFC